MCFFFFLTTAKNVEHVSSISPRDSLLENQSSRLLLGANHVSILCLECTEVPESQKESRC